MALYWTRTLLLANKKTKETLTLKVSVAELLCSEYYVHLPFLEGEIVAKLPVKEEIKTNDVIKLDLDKERIHIFDPISTKKIILMFSLNNCQQPRI